MDMFVKINCNKFFDVLDFVENPYREIKRLSRRDIEKLKIAVSRFEYYKLKVSNYNEIENKISMIFGSSNINMIIALVEKERDNIEILTCSTIENYSEDISFGADLYSKGELGISLIYREDLLKVFRYYVDNILKVDEDKRNRLKERFFDKLKYSSDELLDEICSNVDKKIYWWVYACQLTGENPGVFESATRLFTINPINDTVVGPK
jgi:hypothetical protein